MESFKAPKKLTEREEVEAMIDEAVDESFPASDPPAWNAIVEHARKTATVQVENDAEGIKKLSNPVSGEEAA